MKDNKLIAEFMGLSIKDGVSYYTDQDDMFFLGEVVLGPYLPFDEDWNWLIPVVDKCFEVADNPEQCKAIRYALHETDKGRLHRAVVKFIKQHNKQNN